MVHLHTGHRTTRVLVLRRCAANVLRQLLYLFWFVESGYITCLTHDVFELLCTEHDAGRPRGSKSVLAPFRCLLQIFELNIC